MLRNKGLSRFPRAAYVRRLEVMLDEWARWEGEYRARAASDSYRGYAAQIALERAKELHECWHDIQGIINSLAWMR